MKKKSKWRTVRRSAYVLVALGLVLPVLAFMAAYIVQDVPKPGDLKTNQVATVFAADGTTVISTVVPPDGNRVEVSLDQVPPARSQRCSGRRGPRFLLESGLLDLRFRTRSP